WMGGLFSRVGGRRRDAATATVAAILIAVAALSFNADPARADDAKPGDDAAIEAVANTRIAYVLTGEPNVDAVSRAGIEGLNRFLVEKTALEPGEPAGVDIAKDELS